MTDETDEQVKAKAKMEQIFRVYGKSTVLHRNFIIHPSSVSYSPHTDWMCTHVDYDGAPDSGDHRCWYCGSIEEGIKRVDAWYEENEENDEQT